MNKNIKQNPMFKFLVLLAVANTVGLQAWRTMFNNFSVDIIGLNGFHVGSIQSIREVPGLLTFLVIYVLLFLKEHKLSSISVILLGVGISITGFLPSFEGMLLTTFIMSLGFHYFETTNQSLTLQYFNKQDSPFVFAKLKSLSAATNIIVGGVIFLLTQHLDYVYNYLFIGIIVFGCGIYSLFMNPSKTDIPIQEKRMVLKKKYWLFYVLNLLGGARRQIFVVFAVFLLVQKYQFSVGEIAILFVINNIIAYFFNPIIAKAINRFGERKVLSMEYFSLILVFSAYAFVETKWLVAALYIIDHIFFNFSIAIKTYFQKTAEPQDIAPSMAVSFSINHLTAVFIPVIGGVIWLNNWQLTFIVGAVLSFISLVFVQGIRVK